MEHQVGVSKGNRVVSFDLSPQPPCEWIRGNSCSLGSLNKGMQGFCVTWHSQCLRWSARFLCFSCIFCAGNVPLAFQPSPGPVTPFSECSNCSSLKWWPQNKAPCLPFLSYYKWSLYNKMTEEAQGQITGWRKVPQGFTCKQDYALLICQGWTASRRQLFLFGNPDPMYLHLVRMEKKWELQHDLTEAVFIPITCPVIAIMITLSRGRTMSYIHSS